MEFFLFFILPGVRCRRLSDFKIDFTKWGNLNLSFSEVIYKFRRFLEKTGGRKRKKGSRSWIFNICPRFKVSGESKMMNLSNEFNFKYAQSLYIFRLHHTSNCILETLSKAWTYLLFYHKTFFRNFVWYEKIYNIEHNIKYY